MKKRICSIFLLLTLLLALLPLQANAVTAGMVALDMQEISKNRVPNLQGRQRSMSGCSTTAH